MTELTEKGKTVFDFEFDDLEDAHNNYYPDRPKGDIILACNAIGEQEGCEMCDWIDVFFAGLDKGRSENRR